MQYCGLEVLSKEQLVNKENYGSVSIAFPQFLIVGNARAFPLSVAGVRWF